MYEVRERDVAEQTVLTEQRHVFVGDLSNWISDTLGRLYGKAEQNGKKMLGPPREVYLGDFAHLAPNDEGCDIAFPIT